MNNISNIVKSMLGRINNARRGVIGVLLTVGVLLGFAGPSFAVDPTIPANPMGTHMTDVLNTVITWVTTYAIPALAAAIVFGILVRVGFKWLRRIGHKAAA